MPYYKRPIIYPSGKIRQDTAKINENFTELAKAFLNEDPTTGIVANADKVDNFHASQTPTPNTIPVAGPDGKLNSGWLSGISADADTLDGFHASQTPTPNTIPVAGPDGKLNPGWLSISGGSGGGSNVALGLYSNLFVGEPGTFVFHNDLKYDLSTNKLYRYNEKTYSWEEIDWQDYVMASPEWQMGWWNRMIRINDSTGALEIKVDDNNWIQCIPAVGSPVINIASPDLFNPRYFFWIPPGQTVIFNQWFNHIPIVLFGHWFSGFFYHLGPYNGWIGLRPNGIAISDGTIQCLEIVDNEIRTYYSTDLSYIPFARFVQGGYFSHARFNFELLIDYAKRFYINAVGSGGRNTAITICSSTGQAPSNSFWFGYWIVHNLNWNVIGEQPIPFCSITRRV